MISDIVLGVRWTPALSFNYGMGGVHPDAVGIDVTVHPVRSVDRVAVRSLLHSHGLPRLREWVERTQTAAETWTSRRRHAYWRYAENELQFTGDRPE
jgi:hypothetical protein